MRSITILKIPTYIFSTSRLYGVSPTELMVLLLQRVTITYDNPPRMQEMVEELLSKNLPDPGFEVDQQMSLRPSVRDSAIGICAAFDAHWETTGLGTFADSPTYIPIGRNQYVIVSSLADHAAIAQVSDGMRNQMYESVMYLHHSAQDIVYKGDHTMASLFYRACDSWHKYLIGNMQRNRHDDDYGAHLLDVYGDLIEDADHYGKVISTLEMHAAGVAEAYFGLNYRIIVEKMEDGHFPAKFKVNIDVMS